MIPIQIRAAYHTDVYLSDEQMNEAALQVLCDEFRLPVPDDHLDNLLIKDGFLVHEFEAYTSHTYMTEKKLREATEEDIAAVMVWKRLRKRKRNR